LQAAAAVLEFGGDLCRRALLGAFEQHVRGDLRHAGGEVGLGKTPARKFVRTLTSGRRGFSPTISVRPFLSLKR
jgi:hypothetical protein